MTNCEYVNDTVNHSILINKLYAYGLCHKTVEWFNSYLTGGTQQCFITHHFHPQEWSPGCGVPQGSILGLLLFLIYINDLPNCLKFPKPRMFADDTTVTTSGISIVQTIQNVNRDMVNLCEWLIANKLSLNIGKTEHTASDDTLNKISDSTVIYLADKPIKRVRKSKSLGVYVDERLSWSPQMMSPHPMLWLGKFVCNWRT